MSRGLTAADLTELGSGNFEYAWLVRLDFSTPLYYTTFGRDIEYDGNTYVSTSLITKLPKISESLKIKPSTTSLDFSGASVALHALFLSEDYKNAETYMYLHLPGTGNTITMFKGFCDSYTATENVRKGTSTVSLKIANHWANWEAVEGRFLTHANQQKLYPSDEGLEYAGIEDLLLSHWGGQYKQPERAFNPYYPFETRDEKIESRQGVLYTTTGTPVIFSPWGYSFQQLVSNGTDFSVRLPIVYGETAIKGIPVFSTVTGTGNKYYWVVYALAEGECESLVDITIDDKSYTHADISSKIDVYFHSGSTTQTVDTNLDSASTLWTSNHTLKGICYCVIRYTLSSKVWGSTTPNPTFRIKGKKLYDPRDGTTAYSTNPALVLYDYLTNTDYGKSIAGAELTNFDVVADYCDTQKTDHDAAEGGTPASINLFDFNGIIKTTDTIKSNVEKILFTMRGYLPWVNGKYKLISETESDASVYSFTDDNITGSFTTGDSGIKNRANEIYITIQDADLNYKSNQVISSSATFLAEDNNRVLKKSLTAPHETNRYRAENRANTLLKQSRQDVSFNLTAANADSLQVECGDVIDITRSLKGWTNKLFRAAELDISNDLTMTFKGVEYEPTSFDWAVSVETPSPDNTEIRDVFTVAAPTAVTVATATQRTTTDGTTIDRGKITWTWPADEFVEKCLVQYKEDNDAATEWTTLGEVDVDDDYIQYFDAKVGATYEARVLGINELNKRSSWATSSTHTITGTSTVGADVQLTRTNDYKPNSLFYSPSFDSLDSFTLVGSPTLNADKSITVTGESPSGQRISLQDISTTQPALGWSYKRRLFAIVSTSSMSSLPAGKYIRFGLGGDMSAAGSNMVFFAFRYDSGNQEYQCATYGSSGSASAWATLPAGANTFEIIINPATSVEFFLNDSSVFTETTSTYIPSGSDYANNSRFKLGLATTDTSSAASATLSAWDFLQEP